MIQKNAIAMLYSQNILQRKKPTAVILPILPKRQPPMPRVQLPLDGIHNASTRQTNSIAMHIKIEQAQIVSERARQQVPKMHEFSAEMPLAALANGKDESAVMM